MLKKIILLLIVTTLYSAEITNIEVQQRTDGSGIIDVIYDLIDSEGIYPSFNVSIEMSIDGSEYTTLNASDLSGDIGENVIPNIAHAAAAARGRSVCRMPLAETEVVSVG